MGKQAFLLIIITIFCALCIWIFSLSPIFAAHNILNILSLCFFLIISILYQLIANITYRSKNLYLFTRYSIAISMLKIICGAALIFYYQYKFHPSNKYYVIPFFLFYIIFTLFELFSLTKQKV